MKTEANKLPTQYAKMRELLEVIACVDLPKRKSSPAEYGGGVVPDENEWIVALIRSLQGMARIALSAPHRNCDVGTADGQLFRYKAYCKRHTTDAGCLQCPLINSLDCRFAWAHMPYKEEI